MGVTLAELLAVNPEVQSTREDLVGCHAIQYGIDSSVINETIDLIESTLSWSDWDRAAALHEILPQVLGTETSGLIAQRIRFGDRKDFEVAEIDSRISEFFDGVESEGHRKLDAIDLIPRPGLILEYQGRTTFDHGEVVRNHIVRNIHADLGFFTITSPAREKNAVIVASERSGDSMFPYVKALRIFS